MSQQFYFETISTRGIKYKVTFLKSGAGERIFKGDLIDSWFEINYDVSDPRNAINKKIFEHTITVHMFIPDSTVQGYIEDLISTIKNEYTVRIDKDTGSGYSTYLTAGFRPDMLSISDSDFPKKATLIAKGFQYHKSTDFDLRTATDMQRLMKGISLCLDSTLEIKSYNDWKIEGQSDTTDYFNTAYVDLYHIRRYVSGTSDIEVSLYDALFMLIPDGFGLWQKDGRWHLIQIDYFLRKGGANLDMFTYSSIGTYEDLDTVSLIDTISGANGEVLPTSNRTFYANLQKITQRYIHNSLFSNLAFPFLIQNDSAVDTEVFEFTVFGLGGQRIQLAVDARIIVNLNDLITGTARVSIEVGDLHYNDSLQKWNTGTVTSVNIQCSGTNGVLTGSRTIITVPIPPFPDSNTVKVTFRWANVINISDPGNVPTISRVDFLNTSGAVIAESSNNESDTFVGLSDTDYIGSIQLADRNFGQGPHAFSRAAIRDSSNAIVDGFKIIGGTNVSYSRHVFDRIFALHDDLETNQIEARTDNGIPTMYQYNSRSYFGMGGKYSSRDGTWSVFSFRGSPAVRDWEEVVTPSPPPGPVPQYLTSERFLDAEQVFDKGYPIKSIVQKLDNEGRYIESDAYELDEDGVKILVGEVMQPRKSLSFVDDLEEPTQTYGRLFGRQTIGFDAFIQNFLDHFYIAHENDDVADGEYVVRIRKNQEDIRITYNSTFEKNVTIEGNRIEPFRHLDAFNTQRDDYNIGIGTTFTVQTDGLAQPDRTITGITGGVDGRFIRIFNRGVDAVRIDYDSTDSDASNRIIDGSGSAINLQTNECIQMIYDDSVSRWRIIHD